jgi:hypothetical protein
LKEKFKTQYNSFRYRGYYGNECFEYSDEMINSIINFTNKELNHRNFKSYINPCYSEKKLKVSKSKTNYNFFFWFLLIGIIAYLIFQNYVHISEKCDAEMIIKEYNLILDLISKKINDFIEIFGEQFDIILEKYYVTFCQFNKYYVNF